MYSKPRQALLVAALSIGATVCVSAQQPPPQQTSASSDIPVINLCTPPKPTQSLGLWAVNVGYALRRFSAIPSIHTAGGFTSKALLLDSCPDVQKTACQAEKGVVSCNVQKLARLLLSQAYVAASFVVLRDPKTPHHDTGMLDISDGLILADASFRDDGTVQSYVDTLIKEDQLSNHEFLAISSLARQLRDYDLTPGAIPPSDLVTSTYLLYEASSNYIMAFIFGHELAHAYGRCVATQPSTMEMNGQFAKIVSLQTKGDVLCPNPTYLDEVNADRCALRVVEEIDQGMVEWKTRAKLPAQEQTAQLTLLSYSRRFAIDSMFKYLELGFQPNSKDAILIHPSPSITRAERVEMSPGYLYNVLRGILFAEILRRREKLNRELVGICDNAARDLVRALNAAISACRVKPGQEGVFPVDQSSLIGPFSDYVPSGVLKAWQTHVWNDSGPGNSFSCGAHQ